MPRAAAGGDFLDSISELFQEALSDDGNSSEAEAKAAFAHVRDQLVTLLRMVSKTTAAGARAACPVTLPDGREPKTRVQLPPAGFLIEEPLAERLTRAEEPAEFVGVLANAFESHRIARQEDRLARPGKRKIEIAPSTPRKKKIILRVKTPVAVSGGCVTPVSQNTAPQGVDQSGRRTPIATPSIKMHIQKGDRAIMSPSDFVKRATQARTPKSTEDIVGSVEELVVLSSSPTRSTSMAEARDDESDNGDADYVDDVVNHADDGNDEDYALDYALDYGSDAMSVDSPCVPPRRAAQSTSSASETDPQLKETAATLERIMDDVERITADEWESYRPTLIESLGPIAEMEYAKLCSLGPTVSKDSVTRLDAAIAQLGDDIAAISPEKWAKYNRKLHEFCNSAQFHTFNFCQRLWKVMDMIYLDEETQAMSTGEWDHLETVAKIVSTICEAIGPEGEEDRTSGWAEQWFCSKVKDIRFLRRVTTSLERKNELLHLMRGDELGD